MDFLTIYNYELKSLAKSAKSTFFSLFLISLFWGIFFSLNIFNEEKNSFALAWLLFFSLLASAGFANISFVRERLSGSWEILLSSGISRELIFLAKLVFVQSASFLWGTLTLLIAYSTAFYIWGFYQKISFFFILVVFFFAAVSVNIITAYLTIKNINPRAIQLANFAVMTILSFILYFVDYEPLFGKLTAIAIISIPAIFVSFLIPTALFDDKAIEKIVY